MEAASARYAARDRFGAPFADPAQTPLQRYIQNAVDPQNFEPHLGLNLEIADLINTKKGSAPREAAVTIVKYINHRNANVSNLALTLLDICVKNCGYPFHLQISTKEFLNELVRRFPERPPLRPTRVQNRILEIIEEWRQTICQTSKYKEDLGFIRDMHRLLKYKGYMFPEIRREDAAVLNPDDSLKSAEEMEEEERAAQSAKLQELIRRGGPEDLQEANRLMKIMAGYDQRNKTDYRAKAAEEVGKIQQKARLLEERLQNFKAGDKLEEGDVFDDLASSLQSAQPKIQKMCEEESEDQEAVAKLFEINDSIHRTIERYKLIKKGDLNAAQAIPQGTLGTSLGVSKGANQELSLIDFGAESDLNNTAAASSQQQEQSVDSLQGDLLGLSFGDQSTPYGQGGLISLGNGGSQGQSSSLQALHQNSSFDSTLRTQGTRSPFDQVKALNAANSQRNAQTSPPSNPSMNRMVPQPSNPSAAQNDPFRQFSSSANNTAKAPQQSSSLIDVMGSSSASSGRQPTPSNGSSLIEDDFTFTSALPEEAPPASNQLQWTEDRIRFDFSVSRSKESESVVLIEAKFSNVSSDIISEFTFQVAVTKAYTMKLTPQSGRKMLPNQRFGITQPMEIHGVPLGQADKVKVRWKATYKANAKDQHLQGEVPPLAIV